MIRPRSIIVATIIAIFIWTIFAPPGLLQDFRMSLANVAGIPLKAVGRSLNCARRISKLPYSDSEKIYLKNRIRELEKRTTELEEALLENERLRGLLGFQRDAGRHAVPAMVIGRDPNDWSSVIFIDKGAADGIRKDMVVLSGHGLVGRVREAGKGISKVMLITDADSRVGAIIQKSREQGLLTGTPEGVCKLIYLSLDSDVEAGDKVLSSGMGGFYPKGILIGSVVATAKERGRLYKYAIVKPSSELLRLEEVLCVK